MLEERKIYQQDNSCQTPEKLILSMDVIGYKQKSKNPDGKEILDELLNVFLNNSRPCSIDYREVFNDPQVKFEILGVSPEILACDDDIDNVISIYPLSVDLPFLLPGGIIFTLLSSLITVVSSIHRVTLKRGCSGQVKVDIFFKRNWFSNCIGLTYPNVECSRLQL
jgi:hypothetical protein